MNDTEDQVDEPPKKKSKLPLILGLVLALAGGGGGFYAVSSGLILGGGSTEDHTHEQEDLEVKDMPDVAFVPIEPLVISIGGTDVSHLRFRAQLEVRSTYREEVEKLMPRVVDVLNSYLRAVAVEDLSNNSALVRLRAQMLRRVQVVTGGDRVNDLLIMEFVLN
ncbi:Flagellar FliL protein [Roseovarius sp. THAF9]|uniref:flagellar basal body-associated FliL family protein n=1 Tax=Roseovarius sp. THAF9 TaxID=2587847 RepID=UPI00126957E2|nr:flagellar basal body-associated FliL family protein [Roseovarius sp. THAF9]QFT95145.1 Flagellar FliL protein [Roseovarius sp. THAF9]